MVSTLKCSILQVSISCFFLMVEFPISPGALEGKLFHPNFIQVLWPICLKKSQLISSSWLHSVNSKGTFSRTRERDNKHQKCTVLGVSCENTECTKSCLVHVQAAMTETHFFLVSFQNDQTAPPQKLTSLWCNPGLTMVTPVTPSLPYG